MEKRKKEKTPLLAVVLVARVEPPVSFFLRPFNKPPVMQHLVLDRDVRDWVLVPLTLCIALMMLMRQYATVS